MYKIVIADNEAFIVQLVKRLIDCKGLGVEIAGEAMDGQSALSLVEELKPDILITDIMMPGMDGIELIERIRQSDIPVSIIAISGHRRFDYAYSALKYGVEDFIVKPINRKELNDAVAKALNKRGAEGESKRINDLETRMSQSAARLKEKLVEDCLAGTVSLGGIDAVNQTYLCRFEKGWFAGLYIKLVTPQTIRADSSLIARCREVIAKGLEEDCREFIIAYVKKDGAFGCAVNMDGEKTAQFKRRVKRLFEKLSVMLDSCSDVSVTIGIGPVMDDISGMADSMRIAVICARLQCVLGSRRIYPSDEYDLSGADVRISRQQAEALRVILENERPDAAVKWMQDVFSKPESYYREHPAEALALIDSAWEHFLALCRIQSVAVDDDGEEARREIERCGGLAQTLQKLGEFFGAVIEADRKSRRQRGNYPVECTKAYIQQHLCEQLRLEEIALSVSLSPSYLSNLFKKETGETLSDYIQRLRIEKARGLLKTTKLNIAQIADSVGYADAKYFSRIFRKATGTKPQDYRKMYTW